MSNQNLAYLFCGVVIGGVIGVASTVIFLKKKFLKELDRRVEEMEAYYKKSDEYDKKKRSPIRKPSYADKSTETNTGRENGVLPSKERVDICKPTDCKEDSKTDYKNAFSKEKIGGGSIKSDSLTTNYIVKDGEMRPASDEELLAESEHPEDDEPEIDEDLEMFESHQKDRGREPRIISFDKMGELDNSYDNQVLYFYMYDDTVVDEDDNVIDEPHLLLGDCLEKYGFVDNDEKMIFVQNFRLRTVYEVEKVWKSFEY